MVKIFSSIALTLQKCLRLHSLRNFSSEIRGSWNKAPICKGRKMPEPKDICSPKEMSCSSKTGDCPKVHWLKCGETEAYFPKYLSCCCDKRLSKNPCTPSPRKKRKRVEEPPFKSMWETGGIVVNTCPNFIARLDEKHYHPSDKEKRIYTKTWKSCGDAIRLKKICCFDDVCLLQPPFEKRRKIECPKTACEEDKEKLQIDYNVLRKCMETIPNPNLPPPSKCRKIKMPCCRPVAKSLVCKKNRTQSICKKECCPYPCFAECKHAKLRIGPLVECRCRQFVHQCHINRYSIRKKAFSIPPPLPSWPPKDRPK